MARSEDYRETGRWVISYRKQNETSPLCNEIPIETFDGVMVCNGHYWDQTKPKIPGMERFKGIQVHSGDYRTFHPFVGKKVVVLGCGNSAGDIACELSHHASQVYLSTRSGCYIVERIATKGKPADMQLTRALQKVPTQIKRAFFLRLINKKYNLGNFGLKCTGTLGLTHFPIVNDALPHRIITGSIIVKHDITEVTESAVVFNGGDVVGNVDAIVFCTGFKLSFPFANGVICTKENYYVSLYKHIFLPDVKNSLAVVGATGVNGPVLPVLEMQVRVAAEVFAGRCILPDKDIMVKEVDRNEKQLNEAGVVSSKIMRVEFVAYLDELATMIRVKPNLWALFLDDPKLAFQCFFGPCVPAQYRLQGPNSFKHHARTIINSIEDDYLIPLKTRECRTSAVESGNSYFLILCAVGCVFLILAVFQCRYY